MLRVTTPTPGHNGSVGGVHFADGTALVDPDVHNAELAYFQAAGYIVEPVEPAADTEAKAPRGRKTTGGTE